MIHQARFAAVLLPPLLAPVILFSAQARPHLTAEAWLRAVEAHEPGTADRAALDVGRASSLDLTLVLEVVTRLARGGTMNPTPRGVAVGGGR